MHSSLSLPTKRTKVEQQTTLNHSELVFLSSSLRSSLFDKGFPQRKESVLLRIASTISVDTAENEPLEFTPRKRPREDEELCFTSECETPKADRYSFVSAFRPAAEALPEAVLLLSKSGSDFYNLRCLYNLRGSEKYHIWVHWGRCGATGRRVLAGPFLTLVRVTSEFERLKAEKLAEGYSEARLKKGWQGPVQTRSEDRRVETLCNQLAGKQLSSTTLKDLGYGQRTLPFEQLSQARIDEGFRTLRKIEAAIVSGDIEEIPALTQAFYELIPHKQPYDEDGDTQIDNVGKLRTQTSFLSALAGLKQCPTPQELMEKVARVERDSETFRKLKDCFERTHANSLMYNAEVADIFEVQSNEEMAEDDTIGLWYGARTSAWGGIIRNGVPTHQDCPDKSFSHCAAACLSDSTTRATANCCPTRKNTTGFLALCGVAPGQMLESAKPLTGNPLRAKLCDSVKMLGRTNLESSESEISGLRVFVGPSQSSGIQGSRLIHNEYLISDPARIRVKFLLQLRFSFACLLT